MSEFVVRTSSARPDESSMRCPVDGRRGRRGRRGRARVLAGGALAVLTMGSLSLCTSAASAQAATYPSGQIPSSAVAAHAEQAPVPVLPPTLVPPAVLPLPGLPSGVSGTCLDLGSDSSARAKVCVGSPGLPQLFTRLEGRVNLLGASASVSDARSLALQAISGGCIVAFTPQGIANTQSDAGPSTSQGPLTPTESTKTTESTRVAEPGEVRKTDHRTPPSVRGTANSSQADGLVPTGFTESTYISPLPAQANGLPALGAAVSGATGLLGHADTVGNVDNAESVGAAHAPLLGLGLPVHVHD
ncbi:MAG: hypothetical protein ACRDQ5_00305 [Sciscionella sp.]